MRVKLPSDPYPTFDELSLGTYFYRLSDVRENYHKLQQLGYIPDCFIYRKVSFGTAFYAPAYLFNPERIVDRRAIHVARIPRARRLRCYCLADQSGAYWFHYFQHLRLPYVGLEPPNAGRPVRSVLSNPPPGAPS
jgi:hypothetical protein